MNNLEQIIEEDVLIPKDQKNDNKVYYFQQYEGPFSTIKQLKNFINYQYKEMNKN